MDEQKSDIIINNFLCYVSTARHCMRHDDITRMCIVFYKENDMLDGKNLLCAKVGDKPKWRRGENRLINEVQDVLNILKKCDDEGFKLPLFVCDSYNGMPPTSGFENIAQSLMTLNNEIADLKKEVELLIIEK